MPWVLLGFAVAVYLATRERVSPLPERPGTPPGPRPTAPHFEEIAPVPEQLELEPGTTYLAQADVPFPVSALVGLQDIREALEAEGFVVISAKHELPQFWPSTDVADWYITASYIGSRRARRIPSGIRRLWEAVAAPLLA